MLLTVLDCMFLRFYGNGIFYFKRRRKTPVIKTLVFTWTRPKLIIPLMTAIVDFEQRF